MARTSLTAQEGGISLGASPGVEVRINRHSISIAGQIYQLRNIARVQTLEYRPDRLRSFFRITLGSFVSLALLAIVNLVVVMVTSRHPSPVLEIVDVGILGFIAIIASSKWLRIYLRRPIYMLVLETSGARLGVLSSTHRSAIGDLVDRIADAMEHPPEAPIVYHFGDVILGDQIKQTGDFSIGKTLYGG
jgi:hypothetical protein